MEDIYSEMIAVSQGIAASFPPPAFTPAAFPAWPFPVPSLTSIRG